MISFVQEVKIADESLYAQDKVNWDLLKQAKDWKCLSWDRVKATWIEPNFYENLHLHPGVGSSLILLKSPDWSTTLAIYPVSTHGAHNNLRVENGAVHANARRLLLGKEETVWVVCVIAKGRDEERVIVKMAVEEARRVVHGGIGSLGMDKLAVGDMKRKTGSFWDGLGVCTWESFGGSSGHPDRPTKDLLMSLVPSVPITTFLIDDGWQDVTITKLPNRTRRRLKSFHPWDQLGASMTDVVSSLKKTGIKEVGVWLTLQGYWEGIDPDSELVQKYDCKPHNMESPSDDQDNQLWLPRPDRAAAFWRDWFTEMKSWGIGFVKVDNQAGSDTIRGNDFPDAVGAMWKGMLEAAVHTWGDIDRVIMCMSHNERMLNGPGGLDFDRPHGDLVFRNSDDFNLQYIDAHPDFVRWNVYSNILTSHLSLVPDYDMFASSPDNRFPTYHAVLRCLGPGPMLLSDTPHDTTDQVLLSRMIAKNKKGEVMAVKTDQPAATLSGRWFWGNIHDQGHGPALVAGVATPQAHGALIAAWNARAIRTGPSADRQDHLARDKICLRDVEDVLGHSLEDGEEYALWSTGVSKENGQKVELAKKGWEGGLELELGKAECEVVVAAKTWKVGGRKVAVVGNLDKFATLAGVQVDVRGDELHISTKYDTKRLSVLMFGTDSSEVQIHVDKSALQAHSINVQHVNGGRVVGMELGESGEEDKWEVVMRIR